MDVFFLIYLPWNHASLDVHFI